jgi:hypothetical protein
MEGIYRLARIRAFFHDNDREATGSDTPDPTME